MAALPWSPTKMTQSVMSAQHLYHAVDSARGKEPMFRAGSLSGPVLQQAQRATPASFWSITRMYSGRVSPWHEIVILSIAGSKCKDEHLTGCLADVSSICPFLLLTHARSAWTAADMQCCYCSVWPASSEGLRWHIGAMEGGQHTCLHERIRASLMLQHSPVILENMY